MACKLGGIGTADPPTSGDLRALAPPILLPDPLEEKASLGRVDARADPDDGDVTGSVGAGLDKFVSCLGSGVASEFKPRLSDEFSVVVVGDGVDSGSDSLMAGGQ